jgi:phosphatidylinositol glycan class F
VPLTLSPTSTLLCICSGVVVLQAWWGGWVRNWAIDYTLAGSDDEMRIDKSLLQKQRMTVCAYVSEREQCFYSGSWHALGTSECVDNDFCRFFCAACCPDFFRGTRYKVRPTVSDRFDSACSPCCSHGFQTYLLALLISLLAVFTPGYTLGPPTFGNDSPSVVRRMTWVRLFAEYSCARSFRLPSISSHTI